MTVMTRGIDLEERRWCDQSLAPQHLADQLDLPGGQRGEIGEGAFLDGLAVAVGLAQQHGGRRVAVRNDVDVHAHVIYH
ncbi:hypothetical protein AWB78_08680 [Caballeronia calidae]|uniref:Uncharacterized protein n=1 Tax=Caballeronia calidae TaxID=1777139 RepID=A0A158ENX4_9BURK|nr:hypothetical protein AWB78_08680 [Caballeronia calidae]